MLAHDMPGEPARVKAELEILLGREHAQALRNAVQLAYEEVRKCTENDVVAMAGFLAWALPLRHLRDALSSAGWKTDRSGNFETVQSPDGRVAITSARGDAHTGTDQMPATYTDKGPRTRKAVSINRAQLAFDPKIISPSSNVVLLHQDVVTYFLLHYFDEHAQEIRLELSIPVEFTTTSSGADANDADARGMATQFESRLPLEPILLDIPSVADENEPAESEEEEEIEVPISRREP